MQNLWTEIKPILINLSKLFILIPIFACGVLYSIESLEKAWKSKKRVKKWFSIAITLLFLAIALGALR